MKESEKLRRIGASERLVRDIEQREAIEALSPPEEFVIYGEGLFFASVCSSLSQEETKRRMKAIPCGTKTGWTLSSESFNSGEPNPTSCDKKPGTHKHYLFAA